MILRFWGLSRGGCLMTYLDIRPLAQEESFWSLQNGKVASWSVTERSEFHQHLPVRCWYYLCIQFWPYAVAYQNIRNHTLCIMNVYTNFGAIWNACEDSILLWTNVLDTLSLGSAAIWLKNKHTHTFEVPGSVMADHNQKVMGTLFFVERFYQFFPLLTSFCVCVCVCMFFPPQAVFSPWNTFTGRVPLMWQQLGMQCTVVFFLCVTVYLSVGHNHLCRCVQRLCTSVTLLLYVHIMFAYTCRIFV